MTPLLFTIYLSIAVTNSLSINDLGGNPIGILFLIFSLFIPKVQLFACVDIPQEGDLVIDTTRMTSQWSLLIASKVSNHNPDCNPWLANNGNKLFFISWDDLNGPGHQGAQGYWDIYMAIKDTITGEWSEPINLGTNVNTAAAERHPSTNQAGDTLYFSRDGDIYMTTWDGTSWTPAVPLPEPVNTNFYEYDPAISPDGRYLFFASKNRPGSIGGADLWIAKQVAPGVWDSVRNLGPPVNTESNEHRPYFDGHYLYFSDFQDARTGSWSGDVWVSEKIETGWSEPVPLPPPIRNSRNQCSAYALNNGAEIWVGGEAFEAVYGGGEDVWVSYKDSFPEPEYVPDQGYLWEKKGELEGAWIVYTLVEDQNGDLYAGTAAHTSDGVRGIIFKSTDNGNTWVPVFNNPGVQMVYTLIVASNGDIIAGTFPEGRIYKSTDNGETWYNTLYVSGAYEAKGLFETHDNKILVGLKGETHQQTGTYVSYDFGESWDKLSTFPAIAFYEDTNGVLYGVNPALPARSLDGGITWSFPDSFPFPDANMRAMYCITGTPDGTVYVGGFVYSHGGYVFKSTDQGITWDTTARIMVGNIHAAKVMSIVSRYYPDGRIFIGYQPGPDSVVQYSANGGQTWNITGSLTGARNVTSLLIKSDGTLFAGTGPNGDVFSYPYTNINHLNTTPLFSVKVLPNPFTDRVNVRFTIDYTEPVLIKVYSIAGREVITLVKGNYIRGRYKVTWNGIDAYGRKLPSGNYVLLIKTGSKRQSFVINYLKTGGNQ